MSGVIDDAPAESVEDLLRQIERWFVRRGVPHFIDHYNAREDIFTRASAVMSVWFLVAMTGFSPFESVARNLLSLASGVAILMALLVVSNHRAGRRWNLLPSRIGAPSLAVFIVLPAIVPLLGLFDLRRVIVTLVVQLIALIFIYLATSYAILPLLYWAARSLVEQLGSIFGLFSRALPLLMLITIVMFISAETWQAAAGAPRWGYALTAGLFVGAGLIFLASRLPREISSLIETASWPELVELARTTPVAGVALALDAPPEEPPPLSRNQRWNLGLVLLVRQCLQVLLVTVMVAAFFLLFGTLFISAAVVENWTGSQPQNWVQMSSGQVTIEISQPLAAVTGFVSAFSGLYFAVYVSTDATYRQEFHDDTVIEIRRLLVVRRIYLDILGRTTIEGRSNSV